MSYKVACGQFCATNNVEKNLLICNSLIKKAKQMKNKAIFFPEASDFISTSKEEAFNLAESLDGNFIKEISKMAKENEIWIGIGVHEKIEDSGKLYNTYTLMSDQGSLVVNYRKVHLFDISIHNGPNLKESNYTEAGKEISSIVDTPFGKVGLAICYDIRFPELSQTLKNKGAEIIVYPSVFTIKTGQAHWEILVRARAIETQCYVLAPGQIGKHNEKRESYGNSLIVDPWGEILSGCGDNMQSICDGTINLGYLKKIREQMPLVSHRREDLYYK
ncbi:carbon-nitrogen hydrolase [Neoconidiobolus thromboides FSU 785]|nr:carbon-nitrogen hydrolase [Neoconidiobolus thromboides FSU 785]